MGLLLTTALAVAILYAFQRLLKYRNSTRSIDNLPGYRVILPPTSPFINVFPSIPGFATGNNNAFDRKHNSFKEFGHDIYSYISLYNGETALMLADAAAVKEVTTSRARFPKPVDQYKVLSFYGRNIVASEGDEWKKYRKISAPAFSDRNNKLVWDETVQIMIDMFASVWGDKDVVTVDHAVEVTLPIALFVIGTAGFGRRVSWEDDDQVASNHKLPFKQTLHIVSTDIPLKLIFPEWILNNTTERMRNVNLAFNELRQYMSEMIHERQTSEKVERHDLFTKLLEANNEDLDNEKLTESELIGNIFIYLLAGHETTAHTLCFAFGLLAIYQDEQETLYKHIKSIIPDGRLPTYEEMPLFTQSMAVFNETLRLYPPVPLVPKQSAEDTILTTQNMDGEKRTIPVPKGTLVNILTPGLHYNPRYWKDPYEFKPSRFLDPDWPRDAFLPFSGGPRACLGRKFFETEGIAVLTMLISKYKISVKEEPQFAGETMEQRKARLLKTRQGLTLTPIRVPLVFTRRT